jgi:hypothetical protein
MTSPRILGASRTAIGLVVAVVLPLVAAHPALAATPAVTAQAQQADAAFLAYAPAPAGGAGALCLVDTGVNSNPDTTAGLIGSYAIDNGTTTDVDPQGHGTTMAMIAGAAGNGMIGAWPQIKIVSVRATNVPTPGQQPTYQFNNYWEAMGFCYAAPPSDKIKAVDLALASQIPPSPDQAQNLAKVVGELESANVAVVAAAGNNPGAVQEPGAEPGVFSVGADTAQPGTLSNTPAGSACSFSATTDVGLLAPGCGLDAANPLTDAPFCCADGTSQASAFTAAVLVALMSYDPTLSYAKAEQLLINTAVDGDLDVAAAFEADGLGQIVSQGNANIPQAPAQPTSTTNPAPTTPTAGQKNTYPVTVRSVRWRHGVLTVRLAGMHKHDTAKLTLRYAHRRARKINSHRATITIRTRPPKSVVIGVFDGRKPLSAGTTVRL